MIQSKQVNEWQAEARRQGIDVGLQQGRQQGAAEMLLSFVVAKFGQVPEKIVKSIESISNPDQLKMLLLRASQSANIDEWRQALPELPNGAPH